MTIRLLLTATAAFLIEAAAAGTMTSRPAKVSLVRPAAGDTSPIKAAHRAPGAAGEMQVREEIGQRVHSLLLNFQFAQLDAMERTYRETDERTSSGVQKLGEFHAWLQYTLPKSDPHDGCPLAADAILDMWESSSPDAPTPYITRAAALVDRAWCFRGDGYAGQVKSDAWVPFRENIEAAAELLTAHKAVAAKDPEYYVVMEDIYKAQGRDRSEFESLLKEAAAAAPYYYRIYWGAYYYNQPQWYGSTVDVDAAARFAVERTRAKDGLGAYARYYWHASEVDCGCWRSAIDWPTMKQAMRDVANRYPEPWNLANFAKIACKMNDAETAKAYFIALGSYDGLEAWQKDRAGWQECRKLAGV